MTLQLLKSSNSIIIKNGSNATTVLNLGDLSYGFNQETK